MNKDIEETRRLNEQAAQTEAFIQAIMEAMKNRPPHIVISGLMSCLARVMYVANIPVETVANGLAGVIELCERQDPDGIHPREEG
jgi:hypothetical protein